MEPARKHPDIGPTAPILITGGDPAGVAPELLLQLAADLAQEQSVRRALSATPDSTPSVIYFASAGTRHIEEFLQLCVGLEIDARCISFTALQDAPIRPGVSIVDVRRAVPGAETFEARAGQPDATGGRLAFAALKAACDYATSESAAGILTAPLSKEWVARGGQRDFRGHTEYLAARFDRDVLMLMHGQNFSVIPLTVHVALAHVPGLLRQRLVDPTIPRLLEELAAGPAYTGQRFAMCGLNPHCGDGGLFGTEDQEFIGDWCTALRERGIPLDGPLPADTLFTDGVRQRYRLILSCYHDQGLIPFKALEGHAGVNATIGLPIPRTSPDHGTAFDIAGQGLASAESLRAAYRVIVRGGLSS